MHGAAALANGKGFVAYGRLDEVPVPDAMSPLGNRAVMDSTFHECPSLGCSINLPCRPQPLVT